MDRLSLSQITTKKWSLPEAVAGCARAGVGWIGLWRDKVAEVGVDEAARLVAEHGIRVSSLCRGGFFTGVDPDGTTVDGVADTMVAIDEAARLGAEVLVLVVGGIAGRDLPGSRQRVSDALAEVVPRALDRGVRSAWNRCIPCSARNALYCPHWIRRCPSPPPIRPRRLG